MEFWSGFTKLAMELSEKNKDARKIVRELVEYVDKAAQHGEVITGSFQKRICKAKVYENYKTLRVMEDIAHSEFHDEGSTSMMPFLHELTKYISKRIQELENN